MPSDRHRRSRLRGALGRLFGSDDPELQAAVDELEEHHIAVEKSLSDMADIGSLPMGEFNPESHLSPAVPRLRTLLVALSAKAAGGSAAESKDVAQVAEFLHLAILIHDTAIGRHTGRRRRVARRLLGGAAHWLGGNHLTLRALELARSVPAPEVLGEVVETMRELSEGQVLSDELRDRDASTEDYMEYAESHAGALYSFCTRSGGHIGRGDRAAVGALGRYGRHLGVAWHAVDDLWLFEQDSTEFAKHVGRRTAMGRPILPIIAAMGDIPELDEIIDRVCDGDESACDDLKRAVKNGGGIGATRTVVVERSMAAKRCLRGLPDSPYKVLMGQIASGMLGGAHSETV